MKFIADENFNGHVFDAIARKLPTELLTRVQDVRLHGASDPSILEWAAKNIYIVLTHDEATFKGFAYARVGNGLPMPGVFVVKQHARLAAIVEDIEIIHACSRDSDWEDLVTYLPL